MDNLLKNRQRDIAGLALNYKIIKGGHKPYNIGFMKQAPQDFDYYLPKVNIKRLLQGYKLIYN